MTSGALGGGASPPYPPSAVLRSIVWHWDTYKTAAPGSDLWPSTWGSDDCLYSAWGDGGGFGGTDSQGRVSLGFARIEGGPENFRGYNVNGGEKAEHPADFPKKGKASGIIALAGILYANINLQDGKWPDVHHVIAWSTNAGATWARADWTFARAPGAFQPGKFLDFGKTNGGAPPELAGYAYIYGFKQPAEGGVVTQIYLARVAENKLLDRSAYTFFQGTNAARHALWTPDFSAAQPVFTDANGATTCSVVYDAALRRFLATSFHVGPGQLGVFDAPAPWGPWTTVAYYDNWGEMGAEGEGLNCEFPRKWISPDGLVLWSVFSVYGPGAKQGIRAHDRFNLVKTTLQLTP